MLLCRGPTAVTSLRQIDPKWRRDDRDQGQAGRATAGLRWQHRFKVPSRLREVSSGGGVNPVKFVQRRWRFQKLQGPD